MIKIEIKNDNVILCFPKNLMSSKYVQRFIELLEMEKIALKSKLSEEDAWRLSEEIKEKWWEENKKNILKRIKNESSC